VFAAEVVLAVKHDAALQLGAAAPGQTGEQGPGGGILFSDGGFQKAQRAQIRPTEDLAEHGTGQAETTTFRADRDLPDKQRIPTVSYLKRQMDDELKRLGGSDLSSESVLEWLSKLPDTVGQVNGMQVQSFTFDGNRNEVRMNVTSRDFDSFEAARVKLETQFEVTQGPLNRNGEVVMGNFVLKKK